MLYQVATQKNQIKKKMSEITLNLIKHINVCNNSFPFIGIWYAIIKDFDNIVCNISKTLFCISNRKIFTLIMVITILVLLTSSYVLLSSTSLNVLNLSLNIFIISSAFIGLCGFIFVYYYINYINTQFRFNHPYLHKIVHAMCTIAILVCFLIISTNLFDLSDNILKMANGSNNEQGPSGSGGNPNPNPYPNPNRGPNPNPNRGPNPNPYGSPVIVGKKRDDGNNDDDYDAWEEDQYDGDNDSLDGSDLDILSEKYDKQLTEIKRIRWNLAPATKLLNKRQKGLTMEKLGILHTNKVETSDILRKIQDKVLDMEKNEYKLSQDEKEFMKKYKKQVLDIMESDDDFCETRAERAMRNKRINNPAAAAAEERTRAQRRMDANLSRGHDEQD